LLPYDQQFAYDDDGSIYFMVNSGANNIHEGKMPVRQREKEPIMLALYRVDLDLRPQNEKDAVKVIFEYADSCGPLEKRSALIAGRAEGSAVLRYQRGYVSLSGKGGGKKNTRATSGDD
jgi:hypothetical protein